VIDPTAIIRGDVTIHETARVEPYAVITGPCTIGADTYIGAHAVIGAPAQHRGSWPAPVTALDKPVGIVIHDGACVREFATIHQGLLVPTIIGAHSLVMAGCHIAHDCVLGTGVTAGSFLILGGFTIIGDHVTFGQGCVTHPWCVIGEGAMVGLNSSVLRDVEPYAKVAGAPARSLGKNTKRLADTILSSEVWDTYATACAHRDELKAAWYAKP
jgi:UDP-N-acetylglucosamine acyltransferase